MLETPSLEQFFDEEVDQIVRLGTEGASSSLVNKPENLMHASRRNAVVRRRSSNAFASSSSRCWISLKTAR